MAGKTSPSGQFVPSVFAWCNVLDDGISDPIIDDGFGVESVERVAVGEYWVRLRPTILDVPVLIERVSVVPSFRPILFPQAGVCFIGSVLGPPPPANVIAVCRFEVFPANVLQTGHFNVVCIR